MIVMISKQVVLLPCMGNRVTVLSLSPLRTVTQDTTKWVVVPWRGDVYAEAQAAADVIGIEYDLLDNHDGELMPTLENRYKIIRTIREFRPDLIMTHRPNDYHPDHRYTSTLVQDAAYMVTVPNICSLTPHLERNPVIVYLSDGFMKPYPFTPDVVVGIDAVIEQKIDMLPLPCIAVLRVASL